MCKHEIVLAIYCGGKNLSISHYRCKECGEIKSKPFGIKVITRYSNC